MQRVEKMEREFVSCWTKLGKVKEDDNKMNNKMGTWSMASLQKGTTTVAEMLLKEEVFHERKLKKIFKSAVFSKRELWDSLCGRKCSRGMNCLMNL